MKQDHLDFLDYQITQWYEELPQHLKIDTVRLQGGNEHQAPIFLRAVLFVRKSHLRNLIYRPVLQSASRINQYEQHAIRATSIVKETVHVLTNLNEHTAVIRTHPIFFKHLLLTAFGNLLLAIVNASSTFWNSVRVEFDMALNLMKLLASRSGPVLRLWQRLQGLQELQTQLSRAATAESPSGCHVGSTDTPTGGLSFNELLPSVQTISVPSETTTPSNYHPAAG